MNLLLIRDDDDGTRALGVLSLDDHSWQTIERPWLPDPSGQAGGTPGRSCVPVGTYALELHDSEAHPETWALVNPALGITHYGPSHRSVCLIHPANYANELRGCIAPGKSRGENAVWQSRIAFAELKAIMQWLPGHTLEIR